MGLQANQMLRVRPTAEGRLEPVTGFEEWSFSTQPGRGISLHEKRIRDAKIASWVDNVPPEPNWERIEHNFLVQDDIPREPEGDEPIFSIEFRSLELTEHQKKMLEPPEKRMDSMVFPKSYKDRATRRRRQKRSCKWPRLSLAKPLPMKNDPQNHQSLSEPFQSPFRALPEPYQSPTRALPEPFPSPFRSKSSRTSTPCCANQAPRVSCSRLQPSMSLTRATRAHNSSSSPNFSHITSRPSRACDQDFPC